MAASILEAIVRDKREEVQRRRATVTQSALEARCRDLPPPRDFEAALRPDGRGVRLIAEVKKASPSRGVLKADLDPLALATAYARHGADALSIVTDEKYFQGNLSSLASIRGAVDVPLLRKDFTLDEYQLWETRSAGADAVLLIVAIVPPPLLGDLVQGAKGVGLAAVVECHTAAEIEAALSAGAQILGINNRNLHTFTTDLETTITLLPRIPPGPLVISESGFFTAGDVRRVAAAGAHAVLVGEGLVRAPDVGAKIRELRLSDESPPRVARGDSTGGDSPR